MGRTKGCASSELHGVQSVEVDLVGRNARVQYMEAQVTSARIISAINGAGFKAMGAAQTP